MHKETSCCNSSLSSDVFCNLTTVIQKLGLNILKFLVSNVAAQNQGALSSSCPIMRWLLGVTLVRLFLWSVTWKPAIPAGTECPADNQLFSSKYLSGQCYWNVGEGFISCLPLLLLIFNRIFCFLDHLWAYGLAKAYKYCPAFVERTDLVERMSDLLKLCWFWACWGGWFMQVSERTRSGCYWVSTSYLRTCE